MLAYRNPAEKLFNKLESDRAQAVLGQQADALLNTERRLGGFFNYHMRNEASELLSKKGIYLSPNPFVSHSHPACKTIENHILFVVLPSIIKSVIGNLGGPFSFPIVSCKTNKVVNVRRFVDNGLIDVVALNECLVAKDIVRYGHSSKKISCNSSHRVSNMAKSVREKKAKFCFIHDEIHYWDYDDISNFLRDSQVDEMFASIVVPPEILGGHSSSLNPYIYKFEIMDNETMRPYEEDVSKSQGNSSKVLAFFPDGCASEGYYQPMRSVELIGSNSFVTKEGEFYGVSMHYSCFSHHILHFSKGSKSYERIRSFDGFSHIDASKCFGKLMSNRPRIVRLSFLRSVMSYIFCLKKPDIESSFAKMRQLLDENRDLEEFLLIGDIYRLIEGSMKKINDKGNHSLKGRVMSEMMEIFDQAFGPGNLISRSLFSDLSIKKALNSITEERFQVRCHQLSPDSRDYCAPMFLLGDEADESLWASGEVNELVLDHDHISRPYRGDSMNSEYMSIEFSTMVNEWARYVRIKREAIKVDYDAMSSGNNNSLNYQIFRAVKGKRRARSQSYYVVINGFRSRQPIRRTQCTEIKMIVHMVSCAYSPIKSISASAFKYKGKEKLKTLEDGESSYAIKDRVNEDVINIDCDSFGNQLPITQGSSRINPEENNKDSSTEVRQNQDNSLVEISETSINDEDFIGINKRNKMFEDLENACVFVCLRDYLKWPEYKIREELMVSSELLLMKLNADVGLEKKEVIDLMRLFKLNISMLYEGQVERYLFDDSWKEIGLEIVNNHCTLMSCNSLTAIQVKRNAHRRRTIGQNLIDVSKSIEVFNPKRALELNEQSRLGRFGIKGHSTSSSYGGLLCQRVVNQLKSMKESELQSMIARNLKNTQLEVTAGFAGSGKSRGIEEAIKNRVTGRFLVVSPRLALKNQWEQRLKNQIRRGIVRVTTFENCFSEDLGTYDQIIIDEFTLYPPGYLSMISIAFHSCFNNDKPKELMLVLLMDPLQSSFYSEEFTMSAEPDYKIIMKDQDIDYLAYTKRLNSNLCKNLFSFINPIGEEKGDDNPKRVFKHIDYISDIDSYDAILCASRADKIYFSSFGKAITYGESQGLTFERTLVVVSSDALQVSNQHSIVAVTRAKKRCDFLMYGINDNTLTSSDKNFFYRFIYNVGVDAEAVKKLYPRGCRVNYITTIGHRGLADMEDKLEGDLFLKADMCLVQPIDWIDEEVAEVSVVEPKEKTHLTRMDGQYHSALVTEMMSERMTRELIDYPSYSEQFPDTRRTNESGGLGDSYRAESIYPKHKTSDSVTFWAAVRKRLLFSNPRKEKEKFMSNRSIGLTIFNLFKREFKITHKFDQNLMDEALIEFNSKKTDKPKGTIASHSIRSDNDWRLDDIFLFMKNQLCTKMEKRFCDGKAGQTLACFSHKVLIRFSPYCRYVEKAVSKTLASNYYIHQRKDFNQLNRWVLENKFDGECTESDYEAFDRSQDSIVMAFEYHLLKFFSWPDDLIDDYIWLKCNLGCKLGNFAIMRFTGEFCTFLFNTFCNMAFTAMRYHLGDASICFAGDDMCANRVLRRRTEYEPILKRITLKAKVQFVSNPTFCGWRLTKYGIFKQPDLVLDRLKIACEKGSLKECIDGYSMELSYAYDLGDRLFGILKEDELLAHYSCVRIIIENKKLLSGSIAELFEEKVGSRIGCQSLGRTHSEPLSTMQRPQPTVCRDGIYMRKAVSIGKHKSRQEDMRHTCMLRVGTLLAVEQSVLSNCWTTKRYHTLENSRGISSTYTLEQLLSASQVCLERMPESKEKLSFLTHDGETGSKLALPGWILILMTEGQHPYLYLTSQCPYLMRTFQVQSNYQQSCQVLTCMRVVCPCPLTLAYCTVLLMIANQTYERKLKSAVSIRALRDPRRCWTQTLKVLSTFQGLGSSRQLTSRLRMIQLRRWGVCLVSGREDLESEGSLALKGSLIEVNHWCPRIGLGQVQTLKYIEGVSHRVVRQLTKESQLISIMAVFLSSRMNNRFNDTVKGKIMMKRRAFILKTTYSSKLRTTARSEFLPDFASVSTWSVDDWRRVNDTFQHMLKFVFGAYAAYGFSPQAVYPEDSITIPEMAITDAPDSPKIFGNEENFSLQSLANEIKSAALASTDPTIKKTTWRNFGECAGPEIYEFGKNHPSHGDFWGAIKNALMVAPAPYMGTDAIEGLMLFLGSGATMDEKRVATRFQHWLTASMNLRQRNYADNDTTLAN